MKKRVFCCFLTIALFSFNFCSIGVTGENDASSDSQSSSILRIGYVESEEFSLYTSLLAQIALNFQKLGVLNTYNIDEANKSAKEIWLDMCNNCISGEYKFVESMWFNTKDMNENQYSKAVNNDSVDLVIVMGTSAGVYFAKNENKNKFMVFAAADPILSGIVKSETEKNNPNAFAHIDKNKYKRQIQAGHMLLNFKKIGVVYQDDAAAYAYSGIDSLKSASEELNFDIAEKHVVEAQNESDYDRYYSDLIKAYKELVLEGIDTLYVTTATIENDKLLGLLQKDIYPNKIPTIAQTDEEQVAFGSTLGVTMLDTEEQGAFAVAQIKKYKDGTPFKDLEQVNESTPKIFINYTITQQLGIKIPFATLLIVDRIYQLDK
ncbi:MAG: hypothetical protein RUMPE_01101 [Eubacteriales bacterium SKADARSKE-1]|nr:hypothetical protein [Eubacteriales bacterium SKADARSKE-1]